jgi:N,N'-diacetyllegionaminate synthase
MKVNIIAEAGVNHNGSIAKAKKLALEAKKTGADFVKFQIFNPDEIALSNLKKTAYQKKNTNYESDNQYDMLKKLSLSHGDFNKLIKYCKKIDIKFLASVFDIISLNYLKNKSKIIKIGSSEISNFFLLKKVAKLNKKLIISTGMCDFTSIKKALNLLYKNGQEKKKITLLHCNSAYPTPLSDANILTMNKLKNIFKVSIGYSDHTLGKETVYAAVALGAEVIEKHFTLNKNLKGPDHKISLDLNEFKEMVNGIRNITNTLNIKRGKLTKSEKENVNLVKKFLVAKNHIKKGEKFSLENLTAKRTGGGIESMKINSILNKRSKINFLKNEVIKI